MAGLNKIQRGRERHAPGRARTNPEVKISSRSSYYLRGEEK
jgi:hypothetical protein